MRPPRLTPEPDPASYVGIEHKTGRRAAIEGERDFRLALFHTRESYERALERAAEIMAELRVARPTATVMYRVFWLDGSAAIRSTDPVVFFSRRAFASEVASREEGAVDFGPFNERHRRPRILKLRIFCVARGARKAALPPRFASSNLVGLSR